MDPNQETEDLEVFTGDQETDDAVSVDDFIRQLEAREKDLHITSDTTIIEIAEAFEDGELPEFLKQDLEEQFTTNTLTKSSPPAGSSQKELEQEVSKLRASIAKMEDERAEIFKNSQRRAKDFAAFKTRAERERTETFQNQVGNLAMFLLPALDNFSRAIASAQQLDEQKSTEFQQFFEGVTLVNEQMYDILSKMGIKTIPTVGEPFDPNFHEAAATEERDDLPDGTICEELLRGFTIGDRIIRHSVVRVAKNNDPAQETDDREPDPVLPAPNESTPDGAPTENDLEME